MEIKCLIDCGCYLTMEQCWNKILVFMVEFAVMLDCWLGDAKQISVQTDKKVLSFLILRFKKLGVNI